MSAAFATSSAIRPDRPIQPPRPAAAAVDAAVLAHMAPASRDPQIRILAFNAPLAGYEINSPFGMRRMPWEEGGRLHEGVDIAAPNGSPVAATLPGTVTRTGLSASYGRFIEVKHADGLTSFYAHLSRTGEGLKAGSPITAGQTIGYVGGTGRSTGAHLHFEIRRNGKPLNPALFIGRSFASAEQLPLKDAARVGRTRVAVVSRWPASVRAAAANTDPAPAVIQTASNDQTRVRAVIAPSGPMEIVARDPKKAAEARARLRAMEAAAADPDAAPMATARPLPTQPAPQAVAPTMARGGTPIPLSKLKGQPQG
ncbi:MAG: M23 family metallopeptidase [Caulobacter sp.]|nr:M23 family metallopeptidase [Caulobacter sp.]